MKLMPLLYTIYWPHKYHYRVTQPADFDEDVIRRSPTFQRWLQLQDGEILTYACREFKKGHHDDEERLMRRIMIARRNNIRDHETLKKARKLRTNVAGSSNKRAKVAVPSSDSSEREMDVAAVEATRSYKKWLTLQPGEEFVYNQTYVKGKEGHEWLLKKNIWRRMRYRRMNKQMVETFKTVEPEAAAHHHNVLPPHHRQQHYHHPSGVTTTTSSSMQDMMESILQNSATAHQVSNAGLSGDFSTAASASAEEAAAAAAAAVADHFADAAAIEAAVAAAESFKSHGSSSSSSHHSHHHSVLGNHHHHHHSHEDVLSQHDHGIHTSSSHDHGGAVLDHPGAALLMHDSIQNAAAQAALDAAARLAHISHPPTGLGDEAEFLLGNDGDEVTLV